MSAGSVMSIRAVWGKTGNGRVPDESLWEDDQ